LPRELRDLAGDLRYCDEAAQKRGEPGDSLAPTLMYAAADEIERLRARQQELLATIVRVTNETPYPDEIKGWEGQRAKMLAEIGTLRGACHQAWDEGVRACIETVKRRHEYYELYRCGCLDRDPGNGHRPGCKGEMMSTQPATFAILDEIHTFLSALLSRGQP